MYKYKCIRVDNSQGIKRYYCFPYNKIARSVIKGLDLNQFTLNELSDAARYICYEDVAFESHVAAREFFDRH